MEETPAESLVAAPAAWPIRPHAATARLWVRLRHWAGELVTVFVGVYAAFMLNNYQAHRQERQRREQIFAWVQAAYTELANAMIQEENAMRREADRFNRQVKAGEMPRVFAFNYRGDYDPADFTSLLQSGGFDLLEVQTVRDIREVEGTLRQMVAVVHHDQQISDALILPNLDRSPDFFYDTATKQLRPSYGWYTDFWKIELGLYGEIHQELDTLLVQIRAERARNR